MKCKIKEINNEKVVELIGNLTIKNHTRIKRKIESLIKASPWIIIDMEQVSEIDSMGIGMLISLWKLCKRENGELFIYGLKAIIKKLFHYVNINNRIPTFDNLEEAIIKIKEKREIQIKNEP